MTHRAAMGRTLLAGCAVAAAIACDDVRNRVSSWLEGDPVAPEAPSVAVRRVTEDEARQFATAMQQAVESGSHEQVAALVDWRRLVSRATVGLELGEREQADFARGLQRGSGRTGLTSSLAMSREAGDDFRLLRIDQREEGRWATFRRIGRDGGLEHIDFLVAVGADGAPTAIDARLLTTGELVSETVRRALLPLMDGRVGSLFERLTKRESVMVRSMDRITAMQDAFSRGEHAEALRIYDALPQDVRTSRVLSLSYLRVAAATGDDAVYTRAIEHLRTHHSTDPATAVAEIDYFLMRGEHDAALAAIDRVAASAAADPYLDVLRANVLNQSQRYDQARAKALAALAAEPGLLSAHWALVTASLGSRDFEATAGYLRTIRLRFGLELDVEGNAVYNDFVASDQYPKYLAEFDPAGSASPAASAAGP